MRRTHLSISLAANAVLDAFSYKLGYATELASSLIKLQIQNLSSMVCSCMSPEQSQPLTVTFLKDADWAYSSYHFSHPILTERLKAVGWTSEKKVSDSKPASNGDTNGPKKEL